MTKREQAIHCVRLVPLHSCDEWQRELALRVLCGNATAKEAMSLLGRHRSSTNEAVLCEAVNWAASEECPSDYNIACWEDSHRMMVQHYDRCIYDEATDLAKKDIANGATESLDDLRDGWYEELIRTKYPQP